MDNSSINAPARQGVFTFLDFLSWEKASRDTIDFKKVYVDMTGDIIAGLFLSQLLYWHLPNKKGEDKLRILREDKMWLAKSAPEWWDECRISPRELDRAKKSLVGIGLIETRVWKFGGKPTTHFHLNSERFMSLWALALAGELERDKHTFKKDGRAGKKVGGSFHESVITNLETSLNAAPFHESVETKSRIGESVLTDALNQSHASVVSSTESTAENTQRLKAETTPPAPLKGGAAFGAVSVSLLEQVSVEQTDLKEADIRQAALEQQNALEQAAVEQAALKKREAGQREAERLVREVEQKQKNADQALYGKALREVVKEIEHAPLSIRERNNKVEARFHALKAEAAKEATQ